MPHRKPGGVHTIVVKGLEKDRHARPRALISSMALGRRPERALTPGLWIATNEPPVTGGHPFYQRLNQVLEAHRFDEFVEAQCAPFYSATLGRPSLTPGSSFRLLLLGDFGG